MAVMGSRDDDRIDRTRCNHVANLQEMPDSRELLGATGIAIANCRKLRILHIAGQDGTGMGTSHDSEPDTADPDFVCAHRIVSPYLIKFFIEDILRFAHAAQSVVQPASIRAEISVVESATINASAQRLALPARSGRRPATMVNRVVLSWIVSITM
jgi:hypothetical protein